MIRKALCVAWLLGLITSAGLLVTGRIQPWLVYETVTEFEGVTVSCAERSLRFTGGGSELDVPRLTFGLPNHLLPADLLADPPYHFAVKAVGGKLEVATLAISVKHADNQYGLVFAQGPRYTIPLWPITLAFAIMLVFTYRPLRRSRRRAKLGLCLACGYDLRGLTTPRCPECGTVFAQDSNPSSIGANMEPT